MKISKKSITVFLLASVLALGSSTSNSSTLLQDSSQGRLFPIALSYQNWVETQGNPPLPSTIKVYFNLLDIPSGSLLGAWTAFSNRLPTTTAIRVYVDGSAPPPLLHAGDIIYASAGTYAPFIDTVQGYVDGGGNFKVLFPVVDVLGTPGYQPGDPCPIVGFVGFVIYGTDQLAHNYIYGRYNDPPLINGTAPVSVPPGTSYAFAPTASDGDGDALLVSIANKPPWADFNTATGTLSGTPSLSDVGKYDNIVISVSDGEFTSALPSFSITVTSLPVRMTVSGQPDQYFVSPAAAMISASPDCTIKCRLAEFVGDLTVDHCDATVTVIGGYDPLFTSRLGVTTIDGAMEISCGTLVVDGLALGREQ